MPWKQTEIILSFSRLHPSTAFQTLLLPVMATPFLLRDSCPHPFLRYILSSVTQSCPTLCNPMNCSTPGLPVHHQLPPKKDVLFIIGDWNAKVGSQETPGVTGKFGLRIWNEAGQRLIEFCQENALVIYPLQCSCLENPRDRGAWWAAVSGVAQSQTRLSD